MSQSVKTAVKFSGLSDYPNPLSEVQAGALQTADNCVIDRPGVVSPRRGRLPYSWSTGTGKNLLSLSAALGFSPNPSGKPSVLPGAFLSGGVTSGVLRIAATLPNLPQAYAFEIGGQLASPGTVGGVTGYYAGPTLAGPVTFSVYVTNIGAVATTAVLTLGSLSASTGTLQPGQSIRTGGTLGGGLTSGATLDINYPGGTTGRVNIFRLTQFQLETGSAITAWETPYALNTNAASKLANFGPNIVAVLTDSNGSRSAPGVLVPVNAGATGAPAVDGSLWNTGAPAVVQPTSGNALRITNMQGNSYISTARGLLKNLAGSPAELISAGVAAALPIAGVLTTPSGNGFLQPGFATGYQLVYGYTDAAGNQILGAPSPTTIVQNALTTAPALTDTTFSGVSPIRTVSITLPFTPTAFGSTVAFTCTLIQGSNSIQGLLHVTASSTAATFTANADQPVFEAATGSATLLFNVSITSIISTTSVDFNAGPNGYDFTLLPVTSALYMAQPANSAADLSGASALASDITFTAGISNPLITIATWPSSNGTGTFTTGPAILVTAVTVSAVNAPQVTFTSAIPAGTYQFTFSNGIVVTGTSTGGTSVTLSTYPLGALLNSATAVMYGAAMNVVLTSVIPIQFLQLAQAAAAGYDIAPFVQIYRSALQAEITPGIAVSPTANMSLAIQLNAPFTDTGVASTNSYNAFQVNATDASPDAILSTALYTSPNQGGSGAASYQMPVAADIEQFAGCIVAAGPVLPAQFTGQLLGTAGLLGASFTINGFNFTGVAGTPATQYAYQVFATGDIVFDINSTLNSLALAVNSNVQFNYYTAPLAEPLPYVYPTNGAASSDYGTFSMGMPYGDGVSQFFVSPPIAANVSGLSPSGGYSPTGQPAMLQWSAAAEPESWPLENNQQIGETNYPIQRIIATQGALIIFKPDGVYQLTGTSPDQFSATLLSNTVQLIAPESVVSLQSSVFAFTTQGIVSIASGGVQVTSIAINDTLLGLPQNLSNFDAQCFACSQEDEQRYMLWSPQVDSDAFPTQAYTYNSRTNAWSRWPLAASAALTDIESARLLTAGIQAAGDISIDASPLIYLERPISSTNWSVYSDGEFGGALSIVDGKTVSLDLGSTSLAAAVALWPIPTSLVTTNQTYEVMAITAGSGSLVLLNIGSTTGFTATSGTLLKAFTCAVTPVPIAPGDPGMQLQFQEFITTFVGPTSAIITATCNTDLYADGIPLRIVPNAQGGVSSAGWGIPPWGIFPWGQSNAGSWGAVQSARQWVTRNASRGREWWPSYTMTCAGTGFAMIGITLIWNPLTTVRTR